jgi:hypothetical protein
MLAGTKRSIKRAYKIKYLRNYELDAGNVTIITYASGVGNPVVSDEGVHRH